MAINKWGYIPDLRNDSDPDIRDRLQLATISPKGSNRINYMKNQYQHGSCTGFGICRVIRMALKKLGLTDVDISELFAYWNNRVFSGLSPLVDTGASIRGSILAAKSVGICIESYWNYLYADQYLNIKPEQYAFDEAMNHQVLDGYTVPNNPDSIRQALSTGFGVTLGSPVFLHAFEEAPNGDVQMPNAGDTIPGGHNYVLDEWDDSTGRYGFGNSWGINWGNSGFGTIPYDYITKYAADLWVVDLVESPTPTPVNHVATVSFDNGSSAKFDYVKVITVDNRQVFP